MTKSIRPLAQAVIGFSILLVIFQFFQDDLVFSRNDINHGQWWRIITGNLVHSNYPHLALNLTGLWILGYLFLDSLKTKTFIISIVFLCLIVGIGLYLYTPDIQKYYGFSGALYGLFLVGATTAIIQKDFFTGLSVAVLIIAKIIWDNYNGGSASSAELIGVPVATDAHLYGVLGASLISVIMFIITHTRK